MGLRFIKTCITVCFMLARFQTTNSQSCGTTTIGEGALSQGDTDDSTPGQGYLQLETTYDINCCGVIDKWEAQFSSVSGSEAISFQVWRLTTGSTYELVGENDFVITSNGIQDLDVAVGNEITVQAGDKWGWWTSGNPIIPYKGTGASRADNNQLLVLVDLTAGATVDWSAATNQNDRSYSVRLTTKPSNAPSFTNLPGSTSIDNDEGSGTALITIAATDSDPADVGSLTVTMETATTEFSFDSSTLILSTGTLTTLNGNIPLEFKVQDPCGQTATATYTVTIVNPPPVIHNSPSSIYVNEDETSAQLLFTINATDHETVTCVEGTGFNTTHFDIQLITASTLYGIYLLANPGFVYNDQSSFTLLADCADSLTTVTGTFYVYLQQNLPPVITNLQNSTSVSTTASLGTVFTVLATDAEGDTLYYNMTCSPSSCPFDIDYNNGQVALTQDLTGHTTVGYDLFVTVRDAKNSAGPLTLTIIITDINDPVNITNLPLGSSLSVSENTGLATSVFNVSYSDIDSSQTRTWSMTSSPASGLTYFAIDSSTGLITTSGTVADYETLPATSFTFNVSVTDTLTTDSEELVIEVIDVNEAPVLSATAFSISTTEGTAATVIGTPSFNATDVDNGDNKNFTIDCGTSTSYFLIDSNTGQVSYQTDYDLDTGSLPSTVTCNVTVTDTGGLSDSATLTIFIADLNDNTPVLSPDSYTFYISYYASSGTAVGIINATDDDSGTFGTLTYTLNQTSFGVQHFAIDASGVMTVYLAPDAGTSGVNYSSSYTMALTVTDGGGLNDTGSVTVVIADTTTAATGGTTPSYKKFLQGPYNLAWFVPCMVALLAAVSLTTWVAWTCRGKHGFKATLSKIKNNMRFRPRAGRSKPYFHGKNSFSPRSTAAVSSVRNHPPPVWMQKWR